MEPLCKIWHTMTMITSSMCMLSRGALLLQRYANRMAIGYYRLCDQARMRPSSYANDAGKKEPSSQNDMIKRRASFFFEWGRGLIFS